MPAKHYNSRTFVSRTSIGYLLKMTHALMHDRADEVFAPHGISFVQWIAMLKLREGQALTASDLCRAMRHDNGAFTRILDQLEERGFIVRNRSQQDRRVVELELTAAGERQVDALLPELVDQLNLVLDDFSKEEFAELTRLLNKLMHKLQAGPAGPQGGSS